MDNSNAPLVIGENGLRGRLSGNLPQGSGTDPVLVELDGGKTIYVPASILIAQSNGSYYLPIGPDDINDAAGHAREHTARTETALVVPIVEEELSVGKRTVETGRARITKRVHEHSEVVDEPLLQQDVQIEHVAINRPWEGPPPPPRYEADKLVIPLMEEVLVVEKRLMLKEELHITRVQKTTHAPQTVVLRSESVDVERVEPAVST